jgi:hypothetical protein
MIPKDLIHPPIGASSLAVNASAGQERTSLRGLAGRAECLEDTQRRGGLSRGELGVSRPEQSG